MAGCKIATPRSVVGRFGITFLVELAGPGPFGFWESSLVYTHKIYSVVGLYSRQTLKPKQFHDGSEFSLAIGARRSTDESELNLNGAAGLRVACSCSALAGLLAVAVAVAS